MPINRRTPIIHYNPCDFGDEVMAIEYPLPGDSIPTEVKSTIDPWLLQFVGREGANARGILERRWDPISDSCLAGLRDFLLELTPRSIIMHEHQGWLVITDPALLDAKHLDGCDAWFVAPPPRMEILQERLSLFGLQQIASFVDFCVHFSGLREDLPGMAGYFMKPAEWEQYESLSSEDFIQQSRDFARWRKAITLWYAQNGDLLLLNPSGESGWWDHDSSEIEEFAGDFPEFLDRFVEYIAQRYPFSAWPPLDE